MKPNSLSFAKTQAPLVLIAVSVLSATPFAQAQTPTAMAPPISARAPVPTNGTVFDWHELTVGDTIRINHAVFDQNGYKLYADTGEVISVPFTNNDLYVMKFAKTIGKMHFVNQGDTPVLYVPGSGYLENATVADARWYPFPPEFEYQQPVYIGPAPSWNDFTVMAWYPGMVFYGGYWGFSPWHVGVTYHSTPGLVIRINDGPRYGWNQYVAHYHEAPPRPIVIHDRPGGGFGRDGHEVHGGDHGHDGRRGR